MCDKLVDLAVARSLGRFSEPKELQNAVEVAVRDLQERGESGDVRELDVESEWKSEGTDGHGDLPLVDKGLRELGLGAAQVEETLAFDGGVAPHLDPQSAGGLKGVPGDTKKEGGGEAKGKGQSVWWVAMVARAAGGAGTDLLKNLRSLMGL